MTPRKGIQAVSAGVHCFDYTSETMPRAPDQTPSSPAMPLRLSKEKYEKIEKAWKCQTKYSNHQVMHNSQNLTSGISCFIVFGYVLWDCASSASLRRTFCLLESGKKSQMLELCLQHQFWTCVSTLNVAVSAVLYPVSNIYSAGVRVCSMVAHIVRRKK